MKFQEKPVSIMLATRNGAAYLPEQIQSLHAQDHQRWSLILSDDGSSDNTLEIARNSLMTSQVRVLTGPRLGLAQNFWNALMHVPTGHFAAFCDQDDVWCPDKLSRALAHLRRIKGAALYSSGRFVCDHALQIAFCQLRNPIGSFAQLFCRNQIAGHTCVLNPEAVRLLKQFPPPVNVPFHDWWAALVLKGTGARFLHDPTPSLYYRQHGSNVMGAQGGRLRMIVNGTYFKWLQANYSALLTIREHLTPSARHTLMFASQRGLD